MSRITVFYFAGKRIFFYIYEVFTSPEKEKRSSIHYLQEVQDSWKGPDMQVGCGVW
jgi:hypothetical protein